MIKLIVSIILTNILYGFVLKAEIITSFLVKDVVRPWNYLIYPLPTLHNSNILNFYNLNSTINFSSNLPIIYFANMPSNLKSYDNLKEYDIYKKYKKYENIEVESIEILNENTDLNFIVNVKSLRFKKLIFNMIEDSKLTLNFLLNNYDMLIKESKPIRIIGEEENSKATINMLNSNKTKRYRLELNTAIDTELPTELKIHNIELFINKGIKFYKDKNKVIIENSLIHGTKEFFSMEFSESKNNIELKNSSFNNSKFKFSSDNNIININDTNFENCKFNFLDKKNKVTLINVTIKGSEYKFNEVNNNLTLSNVKSDDQSKIIFNSSNNEISIKNEFKGFIDLLKANNILSFNNAKVKNTVINFNKNDTNKEDYNLLHFNNTSIVDSNIIFSSKSNNTIVFNNSTNEGNFTFENNSVNNILFKNDLINIKNNTEINTMNGVINLNDSILNLEFESNSKTKLNMLINGTINEFTINNGSEILLENNKTIHINKFTIKGDTTIGIYLNNNQTFYLDIEQYNFAKDNIVNLKIDNILDFLSQDDIYEKEYKLLKSKSDLDDTLNIKMNNNLANVWIEINNNEIILVLKKRKSNKYSIVELVKEYYKSGESIFNKKDFLYLAEYLDTLKSSKLDNYSQIKPILDYINNINMKDFISYLSYLFPVSNNILYRSSYDTTLSFLDEISFRNSNNIIHEPSVWSSVYHLEDNFVLGNISTTNINLTGNAFTLGVIYPINTYLNIGSSLGLSYNNINNYYYNINLFTANLATHSKIFITNRLYNFSTISLNVHNFDIQRNVVMYNYDSINTSSPLIKNFVAYNVLSYSIDVLNNHNISFNLTPNIKLAFSKMLLSDYNETGKESLDIKGFSVFTNSAEVGIISSIGIPLKKAHFKTNGGISIGYEANNLNSTVFKLTSVKNKFYKAQLDDYINKQSYLKLDIGLNYTPLNNMYDINLLFSHKNSKLNNSTKISVALSFRFK